MVSSISTNPQSLGRREQLARLGDHQTALLAKLAAPNALRGTLRHTLLDQAASSAFTLFNAPAGYLLSESLAAALAEHGRRCCGCVWATKIVTPQRFWFR